MCCDDDDDDCLPLWIFSFACLRNCFISLSYLDHSGTILTAALNLGSLVFGLLHCNKSTQGKQSIVVAKHFLQPFPSVLWVALFNFSSTQSENCQCRSSIIELDINTFMTSESQNKFLQHNGTFIVPLAKKVHKGYITSENRWQNKNQSTMSSNWLLVWTH